MTEGTRPDGSHRARAGRSDLGGPVHYVDFGGPDDGPTVVLVHGLGGSHLNWDLFAPLLTPHARVLRPRPARLRPQRARRPADERARPTSPSSTGSCAEVVGEPVVLVGNSMGGMISILDRRRAARARSPASSCSTRRCPGRGARWTRWSPSPSPLYALPFVGERFLWLRRTRQSPLAPGARDAARCAGSTPTTLPSEVIDRSVTLLEEREDVEGMDRAFLAAARSLLQLLVDPRRYRAAMASIDGRRCCSSTATTTGWSRSPPPATSPSGTRRGATSSSPGVGHVPQLQVPERLAAEVLDWMRTVVAPRANA